MEKKEGDRKEDGDLIKNIERCGSDIDLLHTTNTFNSSSSSSSKKFIILSDSDQHDDDDDIDDDDDDLIKFHILRSPLVAGCSYEYPPYRVIGSCNGWVCLYVSMIKQISLWNTSTGQLKTLPESMTLKDYAFRLVAFGFDLQTKDFKVMILDGLKRDYYRPSSPPMNCPCRVQIYSLSTDSWRLLDGVDSLPGDPFFLNNPRDPREPSQIVYLNGSCFFLANFFHAKQGRRLHQNDRLIISFDFTKEIFTPIQLPDHHHTQKLYLSSLGGKKMALFTVCSNPPPRGERPHYPDFYELPPPRADFSHYPEIYKPPSGGYCFEIASYENYNIWVLEEDKESWKKLHSFQTEQQRPGVWSSPCCISDDGNFALLETRLYDESTVFELDEKMIKLKLYNLLTNKVVKDLAYGKRMMSRAYAYAYAYEPNPVNSMQQQPIG